MNDVQGDPAAIHAGLCCTLPPCAGELVPSATNGARIRVKRIRQGPVEPSSGRLPRPVSFRSVSS
jgi:hypothetical protein